MLSREGLKKAGDMLRKKRVGEAEKEATKAAEREGRRMKPVLHENDLLSLLEQAVSSSDPAFDPLMASIGHSTSGEIAAMRMQSITAESILNTYRGVLDEGSPDDIRQARLDEPDLRWLRSLDDYLVDRNQVEPSASSE